MENTNTDARKAAEFESKLLSGQRKEFFELGFMAGVKFAKSIHSTFEKSVLEQAKINAVNNYIDGFKNISSFDKNSITVDFCNGWDALLKRFDESLSEQPEAKPTEAEQVEKWRKRFIKNLDNAKLAEQGEYNEGFVQGITVGLAIFDEALNSLKQ